MTRITRRNLARVGALGAGVLAASIVAAPAVAQSDKLRWRMVTSWPKRLPGPGMSAERLAERVGALSGGRLDIVVSAAGEVAPAFGVLDMVGSGVAEMDTAPRSTGRARNPPRPSSPPCLSGSCRTSTLPGSMPAGASDVRGLKICSLGLGREGYRRLGAIPQTTAPAEILVAPQSGVIDGAEFVGPGSDIALGLDRYAPLY
jgi:TRAP-type mannitol/chloroaromatic compound transport system substrate-binding protein